VAIFLQKLDTFLEVEFQARFSNLEWFEGILFIDSFKFFCESLFKSFEDIDEHVGQEIKNFKVVLLELHLYIEACEFTQVPVGVGVFSSENGSNFKHSLEVTTNNHLFVKLRALSQASFLTKVVQSEHIGTSFTCTTNELR
jgi:hypothetical protein